MTLSRPTGKNTSGALRGSRPDGSPTSSFTIGASGPERKRINASGRRSPETHFLNGSKNSEQPSMGIHFESGCPLTVKFLLITVS